MYHKSSLSHSFKTAQLLRIYHLFYIYYAELEERFRTVLPHLTPTYLQKKQILKALYVT